MGCRSGVLSIGVLLLMLLTACGGGGGGDKKDKDQEKDDSQITLGPPPAVAAAVSLSLGMKSFRFTWSDVADAGFYLLMENADGASGFTPVSGAIAPGVQQYDLTVPLYLRTNARFVLQSCNENGCSDSAEVTVSGNLVDAIGYFKASNTGIYDPVADPGWGDNFGSSVALSDDGATLVVGARGEDSSTFGTAANDIPAAQQDDNATDSGAVYVFEKRADGSWRQTAYIKASNPDSRDRFGEVLTVSGDGKVIAVGAPFEKSASQQINGNQFDNSQGDAGAVYAFGRRDDGSWAQQAYIKGSNSDYGDRFGNALALNHDGTTLAVGSFFSGPGGNMGPGNVYVYVRKSYVWSQQQVLAASNAENGDRFGCAVSLSADGSLLSIGANDEASNAKGTSGGTTEQSNNDAPSSGAVYVFSRANNLWTQQAYLKASNTDSGDNFGISVDISADGSRLVVGAFGESSGATGAQATNVDQQDNSAEYSGAAYVFTRNGSVWTQQAYLKASNAEASDGFGEMVSISGDGKLIAVSALNDNSGANGVNDTEIGQDDDSLFYAGAVYLFEYNASGWQQRAYVKPSNTQQGMEFGRSLDLSGNGRSLAIGTQYDASAATGVGGNQVNDCAADTPTNCAIDSGAVYLY